METRRAVLLVSAASMVASALACRVGTPTPAVVLPTATPIQFPTPTSLPTITPLPSPTPPPGNAFILQKATVTAVKFFEGGPESPPYGERNYAVQFPRFGTRYVYCEISLEYAESGEHMDFVIDMDWYDPGGTQFAEQAMLAYAEADWTSSVHAAGRGWEKPGKWDPGAYRVDLTVSGQMLASSSFTITGPGVQ
jgi:hypothetical protein